MFGFLGFILIFILFIVLFVIAILGSFIRSIFRFGRRTPKNYYGERTSSTHTESHQDTAQSTQTSGPTINKKKIFADDEGEYVEFEEVK